MQLVTIVGPVSKFEETAEQILKTGNFQPENIRNIVFGFKNLLPFKDENKYKNMLKRLTDFCTLANIQTKFSDDELDCKLDEVIKLIDELSVGLTNIDDKIKASEALITENEQVLRQLLPLLKIDMNLNELFKFEFMKFRFGRMTKNSYEYMLSNINDDKLFIFIPASIEDEYVWGIYFAPEKYMEYADGVFVSLQFERIRISDHAQGTPQVAYDTISNDIKEGKILLNVLKEDRKKLTDEFDKYADPAYTKLKLLNDTEDLKRLSNHSEYFFYTTGWVSLKDVNKFKKDVCMISDVSCTDEEPSFTKSLVPTKLKNFSIFRPFEEFVRMYGIPQYNEIDPTPLVAITYTLIFGIMFGDLGQGLIIALMGLIMATAKKMQFGKILLICGLSSMFFGSIYDSIFGYEGLINRNIFGYEEIVVGFSPSENVNDILLMAVGLGIGLIAIAMILNIFNGIKQKNIEKIFFEHNGLAGLVFYCSAVYALVTTMFMGKTDVLTLPYVICFFIIPLLLIFFRHILSKLLTGKKDFLPSSIGEFILENVFEMLEVLLSFVTNTISFVRIGAFALNHAGMMLVVFLLAKTTATAAFGSGNIVVLIIGNIVVIGLEGLIVGIQVLRLEFYEIFGRFFSGDGNEFKPIGYKNLKPIGYNNFKPVANNVNNISPKKNLTTAVKK
ncbi:MAG: V-type ATPase kDa subunit [Clostridia bacterium]|nr:V-type ATPase kDa subunit [Clostridia bacterium]